MYKFRHYHYSMQAIVFEEAKAEKRKMAHARRKNPQASEHNFMTEVDAVSDTLYKKNLPAKKHKRLAEEEYLIKKILSGEL